MEASEPTRRQNQWKQSKVARIAVYFFFGFVILSVAGFFVLENAIETSRGSHQDEAVVSFGEHEGVITFSTDLRNRGIISSVLPFLYYLQKEHLRTKLQAGDYSLSGTQSISEIVGKIVRGETIEKGIKVTFPEGTTAADMSTRLDTASLPGTAFLALVKHPDAALRSRYSFLADLPSAATLEGFLFPDTYYFDPRLGADAIIAKMLDGFAGRVEPLLTTIPVGKHYDALILSSIVEMEVRTDADRKIVADIFRRRIGAGMPLQSDATVRYVLGETKVKHSLSDIAIDSPYNTYKNKGLPPGPISNPGLSSIQAVLNPTPNRYVYFLNNPDTGETVFAETFEEHVANKAKNVL